MTKNEIMTWEKFEEGVKLILDNLKGYEIPQYIFAIPKGGLVLGVKLIHELKEQPVLLSRILNDDDEFVTEKEVGDKIWVVDDVSDTGNTLLDVLSVLRRFFNTEDIKIITLYKKEGTRVNPDVCPYNVPRDVWIVYPWEKQPEVVKNESNKNI